MTEGFQERMRHCHAQGNRDRRLDDVSEVAEEDKERVEEYSPEVAAFIFCVTKRNP